MHRSPSAEAQSAHTFAYSPAEPRLSSARSCSPSSAATSRRRARPPPIFARRLTKFATRTKCGATTTTTKKVARHLLSEQTYSQRPTQSALSEKGRTGHVTCRPFRQATRTNDHRCCCIRQFLFSTHEPSYPVCSTPGVTQLRKLVVGSPSDTEVHVHYRICLSCPVLLSSPACSVPFTFSFPFPVTMIDHSVLVRRRREVCFVKALKVRKYSAVQSLVWLYVQCVLGCLVRKGKKFT